MNNKILILLAIVAVSILGISGCKPKATEKPVLRRVRVVLDWTPNTNHAGLYVAKELGYFAKRGLDVQIVQPGENTAEKIVAAGQAQFGVSYQESVTIARSESIPVKSIAAIIQHNTSGFASLARDNITDTKDFEGRRYGSSGWPSELGILREAMRKSGASFDSVQVVSGVTDFFSTIGKDADFEWIYYGWDGVQAELKGIKVNFLPIRLIDPIFDFYTPVLITNERMIASQPELVKAFLAAASQGYQYCIDEPAKAADILVKAVPELDKDQVLASLQYLKKEFKSDAPKWGQQKLEVWQRFSEWMFQNRIIGIGVNPAECFTNEFLP